MIASLAGKYYAGNLQAFADRAQAERKYGANKTVTARVAQKILYTVNRDIADFKRGEFVGVTAARRNIAVTGDKKNIPRPPAKIIGEPAPVIPAGP